MSEDFQVRTNAIKCDRFTKWGIVFNYGNKMFCKKTSGTEVAMRVYFFSF